ncbi:TPA: acyl-CoA synthetase FdrA [Klebsiella michiganensis]|uniref:FdrA n=1 Tax=Klebsiella pneumoniae subsp. pneumoniae TaxID=72407 RepID=A0A0E3H0Y2_KLEPN|nr:MULTISPECIES: acyl-CoA synthetase FdrA [Klebsiella/Raoultella group]AKA86867.1 FdrA [Klebsiella pneumoniae subsp. pneumoniae]HDX8872724.1 acyl-CoA synthetase FdrA [Klebsiella michiganensis]
MKVLHGIFKNLYQDSVSLMQVSASIINLPGIKQASVVMGSETNLIQLRDARLGDNIAAGPNDLIIAIMGEDEACEQALALAKEKLNSKPQADTEAGRRPIQFTSLAMAAEQDPEANLALISVPGDYAAAEAIKAIELGMHVMLFSDNVSLAEEKAIKTLARQKNRLVMGPDCGTAIVNGIPLGFANVVRRGGIGIVGASGTGLQEVTCRIDQLGGGISQALGTGGHDLHEEIGGISMLMGLNALAEDDETQVIVLISKPPAYDVAERVLTQAQKAGKPVVVNFLGAAPQSVTRPGVVAALTLAEAAELAMSFVAPESAQQAQSSACCTEDEFIQKQTQINGADNSRRYIRGVFAGGTFCYESQLICQRNGITAHSNTPIKGNLALNNIWQSEGHTLIDMGDDDFTRGRPHPMIDPTLRNQRIIAEINDPQTAVVLFDLVLGYGAALEPAEGLLKLLNATDRAASPLLIAHVCGTQSDPQQRSVQIDALRRYGVLVADSNAQAACWAASAVNNLGNK